MRDTSPVEILGMCPFFIAASIIAFWDTRGDGGENNYMAYNEAPLHFMLLLVLAGAALNDIRFQKIPNYLTYPAMVAGVAVRSIWYGFDGFLSGLAGIGVGLGVLILPYIMGGMGAGDAKLMGSVGGFLGPKGVFSAFLFTALVGGVYAVILTIMHGNVRVSMSRYGGMMKTLVLTKRFIYVSPDRREETPRLRYGIAIALGTALSLLWEGEVLLVTTGGFN